MPDIDGKYTLTEIAKELNVVPTFINRIQRETDIGGPIGTKGKAASFDKGYVKTFRMVKALRMIGLSFEDIKKLWLIEQRLLKEHRNLQQSSPDKVTSTPGETDLPTIKLVLHADSVCFSKQGGFESESRHRPYITQKSYPELLAMLSDYKQEIEKRRKIFSSEMRRIEVELDGILMDNRQE